MEQRQRIEPGAWVRVEPMESGTCPVASLASGMIGYVEDVHGDSDGDVAALVFFGSIIPRLHGDSCWIYIENLTKEEA